MGKIFTDIYSKVSESLIFGMGSGLNTYQNRPLFFEEKRNPKLIIFGVCNFNCQNSLVKYVITYDLLKFPNYSRLEMFYECYAYKDNFCS